MKNTNKNRKTKNNRKSKKNITRYSRRTFTKKQIGCCGCTKPFFNGGKPKNPSKQHMKKQKGGSLMDFARDYKGNFLNSQDPLNVVNLAGSYKFNNIDLANQPILHPEKSMNLLV